MAVGTHGHDFVLVVPAYGESSGFMDGYLAPAEHAGRLLVVVVLNGREGAPESVHTANLKCFVRLERRFALQPNADDSWLGRLGSVAILVVDRFSPGRRLSERQGVGLARKIGADLALELIATGRVRSPFIAMTDADAKLPDDYFDRIRTLKPECSSGVFPFWHDASGDPVIDRATALYEVRLRYLRRGLAWARSPYAFHTVGSTMVVHALAYAQVRGVPKRRAGEDFYLLGKLGKVRPVVNLRGEPIRLRSRLSERVPFGTGSESAKLVRGESAELYHPECFGAVRDVISEIARRASAGAGRTRVEIDAVGVMSPRSMRPETRRFLEIHGAFDAWIRIVDEIHDAAARRRRLHEWFDGFRTLKLIHYMRDHATPSLPWREAVRLAPFMDDVVDDGACLTAARTDLLRFEDRLPRLSGPPALVTSPL